MQQPGRQQSADQRPPGHGSPIKTLDTVRNAQNGSRDACCVSSFERELGTIRAIARRELPELKGAHCMYIYGTPSSSEHLRAAPC